MKQAGIEAVLGSLPEVEKRSSLREIVGAEVRAASENFPGALRETMLHRLPFQGADDSEANGGGDQRAEVIEEKKFAGGFAADFKNPGDSAKNGSEMSARNGQRGKVEDAGGGGKESTTLQAAGAIGDMITGERIAELIEFRQSRRLEMGGVHQGQAGMSELLKAGFEEGSQVGGVLHFAVLPGGFQAG